MIRTILVYGWYNQGNIGDNLFEEAYRHLFPNYKFIFTDNITPDLLQKVSVIFIGGGSFLNSPLNISKECFKNLKSKDIFYIGVGAETDIHQDHQDLIRLAKLVAIRSFNDLEKIRAINPNAICIQDIVFSLQEKVKPSNKLEKSVLVIPNMSVVPQYSDPHWKHASWEYFKCEFSQFLDELIDNGFNLRFLAMCQNEKINDHWAAIEIINRMKYRSNTYLLPSISSNIESIIPVISEHTVVITQRFHGIVLSKMCKSPFMAIYHHDKLKESFSSGGSFLSYYGISKQNLIDNFYCTINKKYSQVLPIELNTFEGLKQTISGLINNG